MHIAVFFVGNRLMLDDGVGPATYDYIRDTYELPDSLDLFDVGCMSMDMINYVNTYDLIITVDAVDDSGEEPGTVFRYLPGDIARSQGTRTSLHDLKLADLFDAAVLVGYQADGVCFGMQVENLEPDEFEQDLTPRVRERVPFLAESIVAELVRQGVSVTRKDGLPVRQIG